METIILSLLTKKTMYGYELVKELERRSCGYFRVKEGTIYPALHRMEKEQLLESAWSSTPNGQTRRYYQITPKGRETLIIMKEEWTRFSQAVGQVMEAEGA